VYWQQEGVFSLSAIFYALGSQAGQWSLSAGGGG
jgi:hypothetical protein